MAPRNSKLFWLLFGVATLAAVQLTTAQDAGAEPAPVVGDISSGTSLATTPGSEVAAPSIWETILSYIDTASDWFNYIDKGLTPIKMAMDFLSFTKPILMVVDTAALLNCFWRMKYGLGGGMGIRGYTDFAMCGTTLLRNIPFVGEMVQLAVDQIYMWLMDAAGHPAEYIKETAVAAVNTAVNTVETVATAVASPVFSITGAM